MKINLSHRENGSGIYIIKNILNNKTYIGSSKSIYYRLKRHLSDLKKNRHGNKHLQNSWNKYGSNAFEAFLLEYCIESNLEKREIHYINELKPLYNKRSPDRKVSPSIEIKNKISDTLKRKYRLGEIITYKQNHNWKPIEVFDLEGNFVKEYPCIMDAVRDLNILKQSILACLNEKTQRAGKYQFKHKTSNKIMKKYFNPKSTSWSTKKERKYN